MEITVNVKMDKLKLDALRTFIGRNEENEDSRYEADIRCARRDKNIDHEKTVRSLQKSNHELYVDNLNLKQKLAEV